MKIIKFTLMFIIALMFVAVATFMGESIKNYTKTKPEYSFSTCREWIDKAQSCVNAGGTDFLCIDHHDPINNWKDK